MDEKEIMKAANNELNQICKKHMCDTCPLLLNDKVSVNKGTSQCLSNILDYCITKKNHVCKCEICGKKMGRA